MYFVLRKEGSFYTGFCYGYWILWIIQNLNQINIVVERIETTQGNTTLSIALKSIVLQLQFEIIKTVCENNDLLCVE